MKTKYCTLCNRYISPKKQFSWPIFLFLCITGIGGIFYLIWFIFKPKKHCPICGTNRLIKHKPQGLVVEGVNLHAHNN